MKLVLLGPPGSGKGTQSELIQAKYKILGISTGEIFREAIAGKTKLGLSAKSYIDKGNLVPDDITIQLVKERLNKPDCKNGFILDGFPRTIEQAETLQKLINIDLVLYFRLDLDTAINRLINRRVCVKCGTIYNTNFYKKQNCEKCNGKLSVRDDDNMDTITKRLLVYNNQTYPLTEFYKKLNILKEIDSNRTVEEIKKDIFKILGGLK